MTLVLERHTDEAITIDHAGETLRVVVVSCGSSQVKLGFDGPHSFSIVRVEPRVVDNCMKCGSRRRPLLPYKNLVLCNQCRAFYRERMRRRKKEKEDRQAMQAVSRQ